MNQADLKLLQAPMLALLVVALAAWAAISYTGGLLAQAEQRLVQQESQLRHARERLYRSGEERALIARYLGPYRDLQRAGFIGDEQRIHWLDALRMANQRAQLFGIDYQIGPQQPYPYASELNAGQIALSQSIMKLRMRLLHEGDLPRFFSALEEARAGIFLTEACTIRRIDHQGAIRYQPNLVAECELAWITARPTGAPGARP
jgi:hypothetical protein